MTIMLQSSWTGPQTEVEKSAETDHAESDWSLWLDSSGHQLHFRGKLYKLCTALTTQDSHHPVLVPFDRAS
jgi:hypothetical protein